MIFSPKERVAYQFIIQMYEKKSKKKIFTKEIYLQPQLKNRIFVKNKQIILL